MRVELPAEQVGEADGDAGPEEGVAGESALVEVG